MTRLHRRLDRLERRHGHDDLRRLSPEELWDRLLVLTLQMPAGVVHPLVHDDLEAGAGRLMVADVEQLLAEKNSDALASLLRRALYRGDLVTRFRMIAAEGPAKKTTSQLD